jgi:hypothetical protein
MVKTVQPIFRKRAEGNIEKDERESNRRKRTKGEIKEYEREEIKIK